MHIKNGEPVIAGVLEGNCIDKMGDRLLCKCGDSVDTVMSVTICQYCHKVTVRTTV